MARRAAILTSSEGRGVGIAGVILAEHGFAAAAFARSDPTGKKGVLRMPKSAAPAALRLLGGRAEGRDSGGRTVPVPPPFRRIPPSAPTWMSREAKAEWRRVVPGLTRLGLLKEEDRAALTVYCETWSRWMKATREVERDGFTVSTETGGVKRNPAVAVLEQAATQLRSMAQEFGLTPAAESRLARGDDSGGDNDDDNPFV